MSEFAIRADKLNKRYYIESLRSRYEYRTFRDLITQVVRSPFLRAAKIFRKEASKTANLLREIWALKDASFEVKHGEVLGIIGSNGAGKSTLLKILSRITEPTGGYAETYGRVGALIGVGTGFHPELSGRENIYLSGAILGMKKNEINHKFDEIVSFAEIEEFIDTPVKYYSSGMYVRLAFAVAAHFEPEILLVDEVLAVGDVAFRKKCLGKMGDAAKEGRTVLFVSHNMGAVRSLCDRAILLEQGKIVQNGDPSEVISEYLSSKIVSGGEGEIAWEDRNKAPGGNDMKLLSIRLIDTYGKVRSIFEVNSPVNVEVNYEVFCNIRGMRMVFHLLTIHGEIAFSTTNHNSLPEEIKPGVYKNVCVIPGNLLNIGKYIVKIGADIPKVKLLFPYKEYISFLTAGPGNQDSHLSQNWPGVVCPRLEWSFERIS
jgi:lipopolysaccharide transport system ATP-binding protein